MEWESTHVATHSPRDLSAVFIGNADVNISDGQLALLHLCTMCNSHNCNYLRQLESAPKDSDAKPNIAKQQ